MSTGGRLRRARKRPHLASLHGSFSAGSEITLWHLKAALKYGGMIDASSFVLTPNSASLRFSQPGRGSHQAAFLVSGSQYEPFGEKALSDPTSVRAFELLSLAARVRLARGQAGNLAKTAKALEIDTDGFVVVYSEDIMAALAWVADELGPDQGKAGDARTEEQLAARAGLQLVGCRIRSRSGLPDDDGLRLVNARLPISLRLVGCVIECPVLVAHCHIVSLDLSGSALNALDATGLVADGSVHLRRTVVRSPVSFSGCRIAGSFNANDAVFAPFVLPPAQTPANPEHGILNLSQASVEAEVRLERARIWGGLSLRGAVIRRSLFMDQAVLVSPVALIEKYLVDRLTDLVPKRVRELKDKAGFEFAKADLALASVIHASNKPSAAIGDPPNAHPSKANAPSWDAWTEALQDLEVLSQQTRNWRWLSELILVKLSPRSFKSAVRADALKVSGTIFGHDLLCNGLFRMKYAEVGGAIRFKGARLRSPESIRESLDDMSKGWMGRIIKNDDMIWNLRESLRAKNFKSVLSQLKMEGVGDVRSIISEWKRGNLSKGTVSNISSTRGLLRKYLRPRSSITEFWGARRAEIDSQWDSELQVCAVDLQYTRIRGDLTFSREELLQEARVRSTSAETSRSAEVFGELHLSFFQAGGSIRLNGLICHKPVGIEEDLRRAREADGDRRPRTAGPNGVTASSESRWQRSWQSLRGRNRTVQGATIAAGAREERASSWMLAWRTLERRRVRAKPNLRDRFFAIFFSWLLRPSVGRRDDRWMRLQTRALDVSRGIPFLENTEPTQPRVRRIRRNSIYLSGAKVGGDIDFRRAKSVHGVFMDGAVVGGSLHFSSKSRGRWEGRDHKDRDRLVGFVTCPDRAENLTGMINLRGADIGGDVFLIFNARTGPLIDAGMAKIGGRIDIYPQKDSTGYQRCKSIEISKERSDLLTGEGQAGMDGFWLEECLHPHPTKLVGSAGLYCGSCNAMLDKVEDHLAWFIDLRNARATVFGHPPAAWPDPGGMSLDGFSYNRTSDLGPLAPIPDTERSWEQVYEARRLRYAWRHWSFRPWAQVIVVLTALAGLVGSIHLGWWIFDWATRTAWLPFLVLLAMMLIALSEARRPSRRSDLWRTTSLVAGCAAVVTLSHRYFIAAPVIASVAIGMAAVWLLIRTASKWRPHSRDPQRPFKLLALEYLNRLRGSENRYKQRPASFPILDAYIRAAKALREAGRYNSANLVEEARLHKRTQMMSWRHHGPAKLALILSGWFAGFGFKLSRAVTIFIAMIVLVASGAHWAAAVGYLVPYRDTAVQQFRDVYPEVATSACGSYGRNSGSAAPESSRQLEQECPDLIYAVDLLLPFIDLGEADRWRTRAPIPANDPVRGWQEPWRSLWISFLRTWPAIVGAIGVALTAILATALAVRTESAFVRVEE